MSEDVKQVIRKLVEKCPRKFENEIVLIFKKKLSSIDRMLSPAHGKKTEAIGF